MITAIDTNILIDIFIADPKFGNHSAQALRRCMQEGTVYACEIVWVETAIVFSDHQAFLKSIHTLKVEYSAITQETASATTFAWRKYRKSGGKRERVVADFLIGAHALTQCDRLLTRDRGFYRNYFDDLLVLDPSTIS